MTHPKQESPNEGFKRQSRFLRGTLQASYADSATGTFIDSDSFLNRFHGMYIQDDRDLREERRQQKLEPLYTFMLRARLPGGVATPAQWLALTDLARRFGSPTLKLTTRQTFQLYSVFKEDVKATIQGIVKAGLDTIATAGDINRNVMASSNPVESAVHREVHEWAKKISEHLLPRTRAYYELFLDEQRIAGSDEAEPIYGETFLPRKFKAVIAVPPRNDVDVFAHDLGFIAIVENGQLAGFNVTVGGGFGTTHGDPETFPRLADVLGFIRPEDTLHVAEAVVTTQRDFGERAVRKNARTKYTVDRMGVEAFRAEVEQRSGVRFAAARDFRFTDSGDRYGWLQGDDGQWHLTLFIQNGRLNDWDDKRRYFTGMEAIARVHRGDFRLTPNQNVIIANVAEADKAAIDALVAEYGLDSYRRVQPIRLESIACVALPTCPLAMAESERYLPVLLEKLEARLEAHGLTGAPIMIRMTGCPNGCGRPYLGEIGLIGKAVGRYNLYLGADRAGQRLNKLYRENIDEAAILAALDPLLARYAAERQANEAFGDFLIRVGEIAAVTHGREVHA